MGRELNSSSFLERLLELNSSSFPFVFATVGLEVASWIGYAAAACRHIELETVALLHHIPVPLCHGECTADGPAAADDPGRHDAPHADCGRHSGRPGAKPGSCEPSFMPAASQQLD